MVKGKASGHALNQMSMGSNIQTGPGEAPKAENLAEEDQENGVPNGSKAVSGTPINSSYALLRPDEASGPAEEYRRIVDAATDHNDVAVDAWSAMLFILLKDIPDLCSGIIEYEMMFRMLMVTICYLINIFLQVGLLYWIGVMVTLPAVRDAQNYYRTYHKEAFDEGTLRFNKTSFDDLGGLRSEICEIALSSQLFLSAILFLFTAQCFRELRSINRRRRLIHALPWLPQGMEAKDMVFEIEKGEGHFVERKMLFVCCSWNASVSVYSLIIIPKACIALTLCSLGCVWLAASASFGDLILNSLALVFVTEIDELIFAVFLPPRLETNLQNLKIAVPQSKELSAEEREYKDIHDAYIRSAGFLAATTLFVLVFMLLQPVVPRFAWDVHVACEGYLHERNRPWCSPLNSSCFPVNMGNESLATLGGGGGGRVGKGR